MPHIWAAFFLRYTLGGGIVDNARINAAAQGIIQACLIADDPVFYLHAELVRLRDTGGWSEIELHRLQLILLDTAKQIAGNRDTASN